MPPWVWWLLGGLALLGAVLAAIGIPRARRRRAWDASLAAAEREVQWLARELLPMLQQSESADEVAGGWRVEADRVTRAEDRLTGLEPTAPDEVRAGRARALRDAVRAARHDVESLIVSRDSTTAPRNLAVIAAQVSAALDPPGRADRMHDG